MHDRLRKVIEAKKEARQMQQQLSFTEKVKLLEKLRDRSLAIAAARSTLNKKEDHAPSRD